MDRTLRVARGIESGAAEWLVRLESQDCTTAEREAFRRWLAESPAHAAAYRDAERVWRDSRNLVHVSPDLEQLANEALRRKRARIPAWMLAAASVAAVALALAYFLPVVPSWPGASDGTQYATAVGDQRRIVLADGSRATLDTNSVLVERYTTGERRVELVRGRVDFQVEGNPERPFIVHAQGGTVTAIGTRFQVWSRETTAEVVLMEGRVHVAGRSGSRPRQVVELQPGQSLQLAAGGWLGEIGIADLKGAGGWTDGRLYVDNWRLEDFVAEVNRYSKQQFLVEDPALSGELISGVFYVRDRENMQRVLSEGWGIQARQIGPDTVLLVK